MTYQVRIKKSAKKELNQLPPDALNRIIPAIRNLGNNPLPSGSIKMKGTQGNVWRIRVGDYRIIYEIDKTVKVVEVFKISHRKDVYR
jgi:mRNA interferase RelE/StbE